jgi:hypothetical protein
LINAPERLLHIFSLRRIKVKNQPAVILVAAMDIKGKGVIGSTPQ